MSANSFAVEIKSTHWLSDDKPELDLCAHGTVSVRIGDCTLATPDDGIWCISAAALYLLRTLESNHSPESRVAEHLVPCCGHAMYSDGPDRVTIVGCDRGVDWELIHRESAVRLRFGTQAEASVSRSNWAETVCRFSDTVKALYDNSAQKIPHDDVAEDGYVAFRAEWDERRRMAEGLT